MISLHKVSAEQRAQAFIPLSCIFAKRFLTISAS
jgi:hypothetical protein